MELVRKGLPILEGRLASFTCALGITALDNESCNDAVKDSVIVVALHTKLDKVSAGLGRLLGPELNRDVAITRVENDFATKSGKTLLKKKKKSE